MYVLYLHLPYDPRKVSDRVLLFDHSIIHRFWKLLKQGKKLHFKDGTEITEKLLRNLHEAIVTEMKRRGLHHTSPLLSRGLEVPLETLEDESDTISRAMDRIISAKSDSIVLKPFYVTYDRLQDYIDGLVSPPWLYTVLYVACSASSMGKQVDIDTYLLGTPLGAHNPIDPYDVNLEIARLVVSFIDSQDPRVFQEALLFDSFATWREVVKLEITFPGNERL